jgi:transposase
MEFQLTDQKKAELERRHRTERDGRVRDRIKVVLLKSEGWTNEAIAQPLRIHPETVGEHLRDWENENKLKPENGGSNSKLTDAQVQALEEHLQAKLYTRVIDICEYVWKKAGVSYTVSGMTKWLDEHGFSYKQPKATPAKADTAKQEAFIEKYLELQEQAAQANEPILFMDAVHPTMATKISHGWIKKGQDKPIATTASRTRVNIIGAIELASMNVQSTCVEAVNAQTTEAFFDQLKAAYPQASKVHIILDQSGYHCSRQVQEGAIARGIVLHYLPPYSPNLNPIERLWKVMNERVRNNVCFTSAQHFREAISEFLSEKLPTLKDVLVTRINDNFQVLRSVPSG